MYALVFHSFFRFQSIKKTTTKRTPHLEELHTPPPWRAKAGPQPGLQLWTLMIEMQVLLTAPPRILIHAVLCAPSPMPGFGSDNRNSYAKIRVLFPRATCSESTRFFIFLFQQRGDLDSITGSHSRQKVQTGPGLGLPMLCYITSCVSDKNGKTSRIKAYIWVYTDRSPTNGQLWGMTQEEAKNINKALFFLSGGDERQAMITHKMEKENKQTKKDNKNNY